MNVVPIPEFLLRKKDEHKVHLKTEVIKFVTPNAPRRLTNKLKYDVAFEVIGAILNGHNTFGKLRKKLSLSPKFFTDRELKAGIRFGKTTPIAMPYTINRGTKIPTLTTKLMMISSKGKHYEVERR